MKEKVVPIPFLGREVSGWLYRTTRWVRAHPIKTVGILFACVAGTIIYEAQVTHKNRIVSPNVKNHLEYQLKQDSLWDRYFHKRKTLEEKVGETEVVKATPVDIEAANAKNAAVLAEESKRAVTDAKRLLAETTDPEKRAALEKIITKEEELLKGTSNTTMVVRSGQLLVREPHWDIRNNERNWSILARDQQQQKDHYWYRYERSKEDDFARNTYSKP